MFYALVFFKNKNILSWKMTPCCETLKPMCSIYFCIIQVLFLEKLANTNPNVQSNLYSAKIWCTKPEEQSQRPTPKLTISTEKLKSSFPFEALTHNFRVHSPCSSMPTFWMGYGCLSYDG